MLVWHVFIIAMDNDYSVFPILYFQMGTIIVRSTSSWLSSSTAFCICVEGRITNLSLGLFVPGLMYPDMMKRIVDI